MAKQKFYVVWEGVTPGGLHILDGLPASNQRIRRRQIQIIRHPRRSGTRTGHLSLRLYRKKRQEEKRESFFGNIARLRD